MQRRSIALRNALDIGNGLCPDPAVFHIDLKKRIEQMHVLAENAIIHSALTHDSAGHPEAVLHVQFNRTRLIVGKGGILDIIEPVSLSGIGKYGDALFGAKHAARKKRGLRSARNVQCAVRITFHDLLQLLFNCGCIVQACGHEHTFIPDAPMPEILTNLALQRYIAGNLRRAEKNRSFRPEHLRSKHIFNRTVIVQFN